MIFATILAATGASDCGHLAVCRETPDGIVAGMTLRETHELVNELPPNSRQPDPAEPPTFYYQYTAVPNCPGRRNGDIEGNDCDLSRHRCDGNVLGDGPFMMIVRREMRSEDDTPVSSWMDLDATCFPDAMPPRSGVPGAELAQKAFDTTTFAAPVPEWQPPTDDALVNKPVFFMAGFAEEGYEDGEVRRLDPADMLGHDLSIRPRLIDVTYDFGDGTTHGPTDDLGGPWPDGTVTHTYSGTGTVSPEITATYTADYRLDGGPWTPVPHQITLTSEPQELTLVEYLTRNTTR